MTETRLHKFRYHARAQMALAVAFLCWPVLLAAQGERIRSVSEFANVHAEWFVVNESDATAIAELATKLTERLVEIHESDWNDYAGLLPDGAPVVLSGGRAAALTSALRSLRQDKRVLPFTFNCTLRPAQSASLCSYEADVLFRTDPSSTERYLLYDGHYSTATKLQLGADFIEFDGLEVGRAMGLVGSRSADTDNDTIEGMISQGSVGSLLPVIRLEHGGMLRDGQTVFSIAHWTVPTFDSKTLSFDSTKSDRFVVYGSLSLVQIAAVSRVRRAHDDQPEVVEQPIAGSSDTSSSDVLRSPDVRCFANLIPNNPRVCGVSFKHKSQRLATSSIGARITIGDGKRAHEQVVTGQELFGPGRFLWLPQMPNGRLTVSIAFVNARGRCAVDGERGVTLDVTLDNDRPTIASRAIDIAPKRALPFVFGRTPTC